MSLAFPPIYSDPRRGVSAKNDTYCVLQTEWNAEKETRRMKCNTEIPWFAVAFPLLLGLILLPFSLFFFISVVVVFVFPRILGYAIHVVVVFLFPPSLSLFWISIVVVLFFPYFRFVISVKFRVSWLWSVVRETVAAHQLGASNAGDNTA